MEDSYTETDETEDEEVPTISDEELSCSAADNVVNLLDVTD